MFFEELGRVYRKNAQIYTLSFGILDTPDDNVVVQTCESQSGLLWHYESPDWGSHVCKKTSSADNGSNNLFFKSKFHFGGQVWKFILKVQT